jgi:hypothetical protein
MLKFRSFVHVGSFVLIVGLVGSPACGTAGVYDDCTAWYHFDYATNYTEGASNVVSLNEIRDQRSWGSASTNGVGGYHATGLTGPLGGPQWTNAPVAPFDNSAGGGKYGNLSVRFEPLTNDLGQIYPPAIQVSNLQLPGSSTIITRFLWDGLTYSNSMPGWIFNNNLDWNGRRGWMFGVRADNGTRLGMYVGQTAFYLDTYTVTTGKWYDAAAVLTDNGPTNTDTVEFYIWPNEPDGRLYYKKFTTSAVTNSIPTSGAVIGAEPYQTGYASPSASNSGKSFKGLINHLAVWNRALSYAEVTEAFGYPHSRFQIGLNNNSLYDLGPEAETDEVYVPNAPWHTLRRAVTASNPLATLKIPFTNDQSKLNYAFHVKTLTDAGQTASLELIVNNVTNLAQQAEAGKDLFWFVSTNMLVTGTNTFTLRHVSGSTYIGFDWLELAGSWQVGFENNNNPEFSQESSVRTHFYVTEPTWTNVNRAVTYGTTNAFVHFTLSPEVKQKYRFTYTTRIIGQGGYAPPNIFPFSININNLRMSNYPAVPNGTYIKIPLEREDLVSGENVIQLMYNGPLTSGEGGGWLQFDFHRLNLSLWPAGTLMFLQ